MTQPVKATEGRSSKDILALSPMFAKAGAALATYEMTAQAVRAAKSWWTDRTAYKVSIEEGDPTFDLVHDWLMGIIPDREHKDLKVISGERRNGPQETVPLSSPEPAQSPLRVVIDDESTHSFTIEGHRVNAVISDMFAYFYGERPNGEIPGLVVSQAEVAEVFKRHFEDPGGAWSELHRRAQVKA